MTPGAKIHDGLLDLLFVGPLSGIGILALLPSPRKETNLKSRTICTRKFPRFASERTSHVAITTESIVWRDDDLIAGTSVDLTQTIENSIGEVVYRSWITGEQVTIPAEHWSDGVYFVRAGNLGGRLIKQLAVRTARTFRPDSAFSLWGAYRPNGWRYLVSFHIRLS